MVDARNATARDFEQAAHRHAIAFWIWLAGGLIVFFKWRWWAAIPAVLSLLSIVKSIGGGHAANQLRQGTFPIPNQNNGAPDGDAANRTTGS